MCLSYCFSANYHQYLTQQNQGINFNGKTLKLLFVYRFAFIEWIQFISWEVYWYFISIFKASEYLSVDTLFMLHFRWVFQTVTNHHSEAFYSSQIVKQEFWLNLNLHKIFNLLMFDAPHALLIWYNIGIHHQIKCRV